MRPEDFLLSVRDDVDFLKEMVARSAPAAELNAVLNQISEKIEFQRQTPETAPRTGLYLSDYDRQYGFSFDQLQGFVKDYNDPKSVFFHKGRGFAPLLRWLHQVSRTSIGDLHGDLPKHVVATYHRPSDFSETEEAEKYKTYDTFWDDVTALLAHEESLGH